MPEQKFVIEPQEDGLRLDQWLRKRLKIGLRGCRRLLQEQVVTIAGKRGTASLRVRSGQKVSCIEPIPQEPLADPPRFLQEFGDYLSFYKPRELHTVSLAGTVDTSFEKHLAALLPSDVARVFLLSRLDFQTSGILCAAKSLEAQERFRSEECAQKIQKRYIALVVGHIERPLVCDCALETSHCRVSRVLQGKKSSLHTTYFFPLFRLAYGQPLPPWLSIAQIGSSLPCDLTLLGCMIYAGARHQIRAHAAHLGFPLLFDNLYGQSASQDLFFLHHGALQTPFGQTIVFPPWLKNCPQTSFVRTFLQTGAGWMSDGHWPKSAALT